VVGTEQWPDQAWHDYLDAKPLSLPGTGEIRLEASDVRDLRGLTRVLRKNCDTFYSAPGFASLYIYSGLPSPTGQLANFPGALNAREQRDVASALQRLQGQGKRVCIVRNEPAQSDWLASSYGKGPLGKAVAPYQHRVGRPYGGYTVSRLGPGTRPRVGRGARRRYVAPGQPLSGS
jgi:hypothetical protein